MKKQINPQQERRLKFAEAGILFALILAVVVFAGVRYASRDVEEVTPVAIATSVADETVPAEIIDTENLVAGTTAEIEIQDYAIEAGETAVEPAEPATPRVVTYAMAEEAFHAGDYEDSADLFNAYTDAHPANAWGYYMLGLALWKSGDPNTAEEAFLAALELKPDHQKSLVNYGRILMELDRVADAEAQIEIALAVNPASLDARRVMGRINHQQGRLDAAVSCYHAVLRGRPDDVWALNNLGLLLIEQEKYAGALGPLAKAVHLDAGIACIQNNLGVALERTGHYDAAAEAFAAALTADTGYEKAEISLARVQEQSEADDLESIDLIALAESFDVEPLLSAPVTTAEAEVESESGDMEVAAVVPADPDIPTAAEIIADAEIEAAATEQAELSSTTNDEPETDGRRNR